MRDWGKGIAQNLIAAIFIWGWQPLVALAVAVAAAVAATSNDYGAFEVVLVFLGVLVGIVVLINQGRQLVPSRIPKPLRGGELIKTIDVWLDQPNVSRMQVEATEGYSHILEVGYKKGTPFSAWICLPSKAPDTILFMCGASFAEKNLPSNADDLRFLKFEMFLEVGRYGAFYAPSDEKQKDDAGNMTIPSFVLRFWEVLRVDETLNASKVSDRLDSLARIQTLVALVAGKYYLSAEPDLPRLAPPILPSASAK